MSRIPEGRAAGIRGAAGTPSAATLSLGYALFILAVALAFHRVGGYGVETDFYGQYAPQARAIQRLILSGEGRVEIDGLHGPLYPFLVAIFGFLAGDIFRGGVLLAVLTSGLALYAVQRLAPILLEGEAARLLPLVLVTNETFLRHSYEAGTEMPFLLLSTLAVLFALAPRRTVDDPAARTPGAPLAVSGAFAALAFLTRQNGLAVAAGILAVLLLLNPRLEGASRRVREAAAFCASFLVVSAPWFVYCRLQTGRFFVSQSYLIVASGLLFRGESWDRFANLHADRFGSMNDVLTRDPARLIKNLALNVPDHLWRDLTGLMGAAVGACAAFGLLAMLATRKVNRIQGAFLVVGLAQFSILLLMFHRVRFSVPLLPYYGFAAGWFIARLGVRRPVAARRLAVAALGLTAALGAWSNARTIGSGPVEVLAIRDRLRAEDPSGAHAGWRSGLCARKPHLAYYLEMNAVPFPYVEDYQRLVALCRERGADYLFYGPAESKTRTPFRSLLDPREPHPGLEPVVTLDEPPAILYRLTGSAADGGPFLTPPERRPARARRGDDCVTPSDAPDAPSTAPRGRRSSAPANRTAPACAPPSAAG